MRNRSTTAAAAATDACAKDDRLLSIWWLNASTMYTVSAIAHKISLSLSPDHPNSMDDDDGFWGWVGVLYLEVRSKTTAVCYTIPLCCVILDDATCVDEDGRSCGLNPKSSGSAEVAQQQDKTTTDNTACRWSSSESERSSSSSSDWCSGYNIGNVEGPESRG